MEQQETVQKKRGRPRRNPEASLVEQQRIIDEGNEKLSSHIEIPKEFEEHKNEDTESIGINPIQEEIPVEDNKVKITDKNTAYYTWDTFDSVYEKSSELIGKSVEYIKNSCINCSDDVDRFNTILGLISKSCLPIHKYNVGDYIYVPQKVADNTSNGFGIIEVKFLYKPKKVQINKIIYTNKLQYSFVGFTKLIVLQEYCCNTESECQALCNKLNG